MSGYTLHSRTGSVHTRLEEVVSSLADPAGRHRLTPVRVRRAARPRRRAKCCEVSLQKSFRPDTLRQCNRVYYRTTAPEAMSPPCRWVRILCRLLSQNLAASLSGLLAGRAVKTFIRA